MTSSQEGGPRPVSADRPAAPGFPLEPGERVLWQGRPEARALGRHLLKVRWLAAYFGLLLAWKASLIVEMRGLHPQETADAAILLAQALFLMGLITLFARALARSTTYTVTNLRIVIRHGVALSGTADIPLNALRSVAVRIHRDGRGDVALGVHAGGVARYGKLWPHVRGLPGPAAVPMLRGLPDAAILGTMLVRRLEARPSTGTIAGPVALPVTSAVVPRPAKAAAG